MSDPVADFIQAACVPRDSGHSSGTLEAAERIRAAHPEVEKASIYTAAILGDEATIRDLLRQHPKESTARGGPYGWDALTYLSFSRYLRLAADRSEDFVRAAAALLDAGADANTGFYEENHRPHPGFESALYGAAGVAHHSGLTQLLLERGADPNDEEVTYHAPETSDNRALVLLLKTGKLTAQSLATMLLRKSDWHDFEGVTLLLEHGADPNLITRWGFNALHQSVRRDNSQDIVSLLLNYGANPQLETRDNQPLEHKPASAMALAARRGRKDLLELFAKFGGSLAGGGIDHLLAACACNQPGEIAAIVRTQPALLQTLQKHGPTLLTEFAGNGNDEGIGHLIDLGIPVDSLYAGDGYFGIARNSTALHVAAWRLRPQVVALLIARGAAINQADGQERTALQLAVTACVDSHWAARRSPEVIGSLLAAGASVEGVKFPCGYAPIDQLLKSHGATA